MHRAYQAIALHKIFRSINKTFDWISQGFIFFSLLYASYRLLFFIGNSLSTSVRGEPMRHSGSVVRVISYRYKIKCIKMNKSWPLKPGPGLFPPTRCLFVCFQVPLLLLVQPLSHCVLLEWQTSDLVKAALLYKAVLVMLIQSYLRTLLEGTVKGTPLYHQVWAW